jgi:hypothetical protein
MEEGNARTAEELYAAVERAKVAERVARQAWRIAEATADLLLLASQETEGFSLGNKGWAAYEGIGNLGRRLATESGETLARLKVEAESAAYAPEPEISRAERPAKFAVGQFVKVSPPGKNPWFGKVVEDSGIKLVMLATGGRLQIPENWMEPA